MAHVLPPLPYAPEALEPHIDAQTMNIHHGKHHQAYVTNLNAAIEKAPELASWSIDELCSKINEVPEAVRTAVRNNGGGHANHALYWGLLAPGTATSKAPSGELGEMITRDFATLDACKAALKAAGLAQFGSGWAWLVKTATSRLVVRGLPNQDSPLLEGELPIVGLDVWEHAYYLKYQNRRADYLAAYWNVVNWAEVAKRFAA